MAQAAVVAARGGRAGRQGGGGTRQRLSGHSAPLLRATCAAAAERVPLQLRPPQQPASHPSALSTAASPTHRTFFRRSPTLMHAPPTTAAHQPPSATGPPPHRIFFRRSRSSRSLVSSAEEVTCGGGWGRMGVGMAGVEWCGGGEGWRDGRRRGGCRGAACSAAAIQRRHAPSSRAGSRCLHCTAHNSPRRLQPLQRSRAAAPCAGPTNVMPELQQLWQHAAAHTAGSPCQRHLCNTPGQCGTLAAPRPTRASVTPAAAAPRQSSTRGAPASSGRP